MSSCQCTKIYNPECRRCEPPSAGAPAGDPRDALIVVLAGALRSIGKNVCGREALAAAYARGVLEEQGLAR